MSGLLPYAICFGVGLVAGALLGFMGRNGTVDSLNATIVKLSAELAGKRIQTSRSAPESPEQLATVARLHQSPHSGSPARTAPLPTGIRYIVDETEALVRHRSGEPVEFDDEPISDAEYARRFGREA